MRSCILLTLALAVLAAPTLADNFCTTQTDLNPNYWWFPRDDAMTQVARETSDHGTITCSALSTYLLSKVAGTPSAWSKVTCKEVWQTSWQDGGSSEIKNIAEHLWTFGTKCCGAAYKTRMGTTCYGCSQVGGAGKTVDSMGWYTASGSSTPQVASPGAGIKTGAGTGLGPGKFCSVSQKPATNSACKIASWADKKHGDTTADAAYSTCDTCTVLISTSTYKTCTSYCAAQQGGLVCAGAWDEVLDSCQKKILNDGTSPLTCASTYSRSSDFMCKCCPASGCPVPPPAPTSAPTTPTAQKTTTPTSSGSSLLPQLLLTGVSAVAAAFVAGR
jgi:hypothetical protein